MARQHRTGIAMFVVSSLVLGLASGSLTRAAGDQGSEVRPPTRDEVLRYRGHLGNLRDSDGRVIWTPALPGASADVRRDWLQKIASAGGTHVPIGPFDGGPAYPGVQWDNPDWTQDAAAIRGLLLEILRTPSAAGHGLVPVVFIDGGGEDPGERLPVVMPTIARALDGIGPHTVTLPCGWEPEAWTARECADAVQAWHPLSQGSVLAWHGWPGASNGSSRPVEGDDPWAGDATAGDPTSAGAGERFWRSTPFEMFLFQSLPVRTMRQARCDRSEAVTEPDGVSGLAYADDCWMNRLEDAVARVGAGQCNDGIGRVRPCGWPRRQFVVFETSTYWDFRGQTEPGVVALVANRAREVCRRYDVDCGFGNGLPTN